MTPTQHVLLALSLTAVLFIIASDGWGASVAKVQPISAAPKR